MHSASLGRELRPLRAGGAPRERAARGAVPSRRPHPRRVQRSRSREGPAREHRSTRGERRLPRRARGGAVSYARVRAVIFDVDGVLLDARASYHAVAEEAARRAVREVLGRSEAPFDRAPEVSRFKAAGGFNDDWEMARGIALLLHLREIGKAPELGDYLARADGRGVEGLSAAFPDVASLYPQTRLSRLCGALYGGRSRCPELFGFEASEAIPDPPERGFWERET